MSSIYAKFRIFDQHKRHEEAERFFSIQATVSLKVVSRKRRRKCTLKSYDRFTNS